MNLLALAATLIVSGSINTVSLSTTATETALVASPGTEKAIANTEGAAFFDKVLNYVRAYIDIKWTGRGFLCAKDGTSCQASGGIGFGRPDMFSEYPDQTEGFPPGSIPAVFLTYNGDPVGPGATSLSERTLRVRTRDVIEGTMPDGTTIFIPHQPIEYDPATEAYFFYCYDVTGD